MEEKGITKLCNNLSEVMGESDPSTQSTCWKHVACFSGVALTSQQPVMIEVHSSFCKPKHDTNYRKQLKHRAERFVFLLLIKFNDVSF